MLSDAYYFVSFYFAVIKEFGNTVITEQHVFANHLTALDNDPFSNEHHLRVTQKRFKEAADKEQDEHLVNV